MPASLRNRKGITLIELLIVVIVLAVLAVVAVPQFSSTSEKARTASLESGLGELRNAIELYYHQHGNTYPGARSHLDGTPTRTTEQAGAALVSQLTLYSDAKGVTSTTQSEAHRYGPYLKKGLPANPYNGLSTVTTDLTTTSIGAAATDGSSGWKFYVQTGKLVANDGGHDTR